MPIRIPGSRSAPVSASGIGSEVIRRAGARVTLGEGAHKRSPGKVHLEEPHEVVLPPALPPDHRLPRPPAGELRRNRAALQSGRVLRRAHPVVGDHREPLRKAEEPVRTEMMGRRERGELVITQDFTFEDGHRQQRVWRVRKIDDHHYDATANDVVGVSHGLAYGNTFHWEYRVAGTPP